MLDINNLLTKVYISIIKVYHNFTCCRSLAARLRFGTLLTFRQLFVSRLSLTKESNSYLPEYQRNGQQTKSRRNYALWAAIYKSSFPKLWYLCQETQQRSIGSVWELPQGFSYFTKECRTRTRWCANHVKWASYPRIGGNIDGRRWNKVNRQHDWEGGEFKAKSEWHNCLGIEIYDTLRATQLSDLHETAGKPTQDVMRERLHHLAAVETLQNTNQPEFSRWADTRLDRWLVDWCLRNGKENSARSIAKEKGIEVRGYPRLVHIKFYVVFRHWWTLSFSRT
jgi:hypothetical protein